jgi:hypothetical protein
VDESIPADGIRENTVQDNVGEVLNEELENCMEADYMKQTI